jgi:Cu-Zn family superoxide dismutase
MEVSGAMKDLPTGMHGLHIHENGDCSKPGGHFAPTGTPHGDLGNVEADASNQAVVSINVPGLVLQGKNSILGRTVVVNAGPDDLSSQQSGNSGNVIGCGVIAADGDAEVRPENRGNEAAG